MKRLLLLLCMLTVSGAAIAQFNGPGLTPQSNLNEKPVFTTDPAILYPGLRELRLEAGDLLTVKVLGPGDYVTTPRIEADGTADIALVGVVHLAGLTLTQAQELIAKDLTAAQMFRNPQVVISVTEGPNASVAVIGEVHAVVPLLGQRRLLDVLAAAGGLPPTASHVITIDRPGSALPITVDIGTDPARSSLSNIPIFPGDTIIVSRVGVVYVLGAFKTQGLIPLSGNTPLTLLQVSALSGGAAFEARNNDLRIIRTIGNKRTLVKVDYKKILNGSDPDDIVFLPSNTLKAAISNGGLSTIFSAISLLFSVITFTRYQ
jgi:polysaccharide export outer membrane protein